MDDATDVLFYPQDIFNYCHCTTAAGLRWRGGGTLPSTQRPVVNPVTEPIESGATVVDPARGGFAEQPALSHGTMVAGVLAANRDDRNQGSFNMHGVAYNSISSNPATAR